MPDARVWLALRRKAILDGDREAGLYKNRANTSREGKGIWSSTAQGERTSSAVGRHFLEVEEFSGEGTEEWQTRATRDSFFMMTLGAGVIDLYLSVTRTGQTNLERRLGKEAHFVL
jgi:hypothetical protein